MKLIHNHRGRAHRDCVGAGALTLLLTICCGFAYFCTQGKEPTKPGRPDLYSPDWDQFSLDSYTNPRQLSIFRAGAGKARPAEHWVFEWIDEGQRLRSLHKAVLRTEYIPWTWRSVGDGRYLVTFDDRFEPPGTTANCLVMYDFVRGTTVHKRADDFVPTKWLRNLSSRQQWDIGPAYIDPLLHRVYPNSLRASRSGGCPFLVVDLPSMTVRTLENVPESLPERVYRETADGHTWEWEFSMDSEFEPNWLDHFALPRLLKGKRVQPLADMRPFGTSGKEVFFRLDESSGDYVRCTAEEWRDPPDLWVEAKRQEDGGHRSTSGCPSQERHARR